MIYRKVLIICCCILGLSFFLSAFKPNTLIDKRQGQTPTPGTEQTPYPVVIPIESMAKKIPWLPLNKSRVPGSAFLVINANSPVLANMNTRHALAAAIDKQAVLEMAKKYYEVKPQIATSLTPPNVLGVDLTNSVGIKFDEIEAKQWLEKAGYKDESPSPKITLLAWVSGTRPGYRYLLAQKLAEMWKTTLGVETKIITTENPFSEKNLNNWDVFMMIWGADMVDPDNFLGELFAAGKDVNIGGFSSKKFDDLIGNGRFHMTNPPERQRLYIEAEKLLCEEDVAVIPLYFVDNFKR